MVWGDVSEAHSRCWSWWDRVNAKAALDHIQDHAGIFKEEVSSSSGNFR